MCGERNQVGLILVDYKLKLNYSYRGFKYIGAEITESGKKQ